jgi:hypothetical protein
MRLVAPLQFLEVAMSDNLLNRARQALQRTDDVPVPLPAVDRAAGDALIARARSALEKDAALPLPASSTAPPPRIEHVRLPMTCSATGKPFIAVAERHGDELRFVAHELPEAGRRATGAGPARLSGTYRHLTHADGWTCPHCGTAGGSWICECAAAPDSLHCGGSRGRRHYCACGRLEERHFVQADTIAVRGQSVAASPSSRAPAAGSGANLPAIIRKR